MSNKPVTEALKVVLADSYSLYLKTHNYHWNVEGVHFKMLHEMFEEQYTELAGAVDEIAERIRTLGEKAPGTFAAFTDLSSIKPGNENADASSMVKDLADSQDVMVESLKKALEAAQTANDEVTIGLVTDRMGVHEKAAWILKSTAA